MVDTNREVRSSTCSPSSQIIPAGGICQYTEDTLFSGKLGCRQPKNGYRYSIDAVLLANVAAPYAQGKTVLDLCCGSGVVGLILAYRCQNVQVIGLELQDDMATIARHNGQQNGYGKQWNIIQGDLCQIGTLMPPESVDLVVCNPPYGTARSGRINQKPETAVARHEIHATLEDCVRAAAFAIKNRARVVSVYPASQLTQLLVTLNASRLVAKTVYPVYSYPEATEAKLILVEAIKNGGNQCTLTSPLFIYEKRGGAYSSAVQKMYDG